MDTAHLQVTYLKMDGYNITEAEPLLEQNISRTTPLADTDACDTGIGLHVVRLVANVYLCLPIAVIGIIGNTLSLIVMQRQYRKQSTTTYLQVLAVVDIIVLITTLLMQSLRYFEPCFDVFAGYNRHFIPYLMIIVYPCVFVLRLAGAWLTVSLTVDRWIAVCYPLSAQRLCTLSRSYKQVVVISVASLCYSLPRFFEYQLDETAEHGYTSTPLNKNEIYTIVYQLILFFLIMYLVPMATMSILNISLIRALRRALGSGLEMEPLGSKVNNKRRKEDQQSVTAVVASVVVMFLLCHLLAMTSHLLYALEVCFPKQLASVNDARRYMSHINNVMVALNSACNFVIYCACSRLFREEFQQLFCSRCAKPAKYRWRSSLASKNTMSYSLQTSI